MIGISVATWRFLINTLWTLMVSLIKLLALMIQQYMTLKSIILIFLLNVLTLKIAVKCGVSVGGECFLFHFWIYIIIYFDVFLYLDWTCLGVLLQVLFLIHVFQFSFYFLNMNFKKVVFTNMKSDFVFKRLQKSFKLSYLLSLFFICLLRFF